MNPLRPYSPTPANPWTAAKVGHLYRRAGFGATLEQVEAGLKAGPQATVDKLLAGEPASDEYTRTSEYLASERSLPKGASANQLAAWWLARILASPHPLREKVTLFWHNHFATSNAKVMNARFMLGQYRLLHEHALGDFRKLLVAMTTDAAMMVWLDTVESKKGKPNENYARELMELFSLGLGHYTEADVREAARAFTGYEIAAGRGAFNPHKHDATHKKVLGRTGAFTGEDVVKLCLGHPASPRFLAKKLYRELVSEAAEPPADLLDAMAKQYRDSDFDTLKLVETVIRSEHFFSDAAYRQKVKSPVEFVVGLVRGFHGQVGALRLAEAIEGLGQVLFAPPSVKGWDGGPAWLNAQTLLFRQNLALALTSTDDARFGPRCDPAAWLAARGATSDEKALDALLSVTLQNDAPPAARDAVRASLAAPAPRARLAAAGDARKTRLRAAAHAVLSLPEYQLN